MKVNELFNTEVMDMSVDELLDEINAYLDEIAPDGKTSKHFNGGYIQQMKNNAQLVAYFGTKADGKNRDSVKISIPDSEIDDVYMMLKAKIHDMNNEGTKKVSVSFAQRRLAKKKIQPRDEW
jgi:hypothetical protein